MRKRRFRLVRTLFALLLLSSSISSRAQHYNTLFLDLTPATIPHAQFDFTSIAEKVSVHEKVDFFLDKVVLRDTNSIFYYTRFNSYSELQKARQQRSVLYTNIDTAEINANLHFLDLNQDGEMDCVYYRVNLSYDFQSIEVFLTIKSKLSKSIRIPGFLITHFSFNGNMHFETYAWSCCDDPFRHYRTMIYDNEKLLEHVHYHIPRRMPKPKEHLDYRLVSIDKELTMYLSPESDWPVNNGYEEITLKASQQVLAIAYSSDYLLVIGEYHQKEDPEVNNKMVGWIKK